MRQVLLLWQLLGGIPSSHVRVSGLTGSTPLDRLGAREVELSIVEALLLR